MAIRFRKTIKIAPGLKLNIGKKSASVRIGPKHAGFTTSTTGKKTTSVGIPKTGLAFTSTTGGGSKPKRNQSRAGNTGALRGGIILVAILFGVAWCAIQTHTNIDTAAPHKTPNSGNTQTAPTKP